MNISNVFQAGLLGPTRGTDSSPNQISPAGGDSQTTNTTVSGAGQTEQSPAAAAAESVAATSSEQDLNVLATTVVNASGTAPEPGSIIDIFI